MVKNFQKIKFATYSNLEKYFTEIILPQNNKSSKVIGKTLLVWDKQSNQGAKTMPKTYQILSYQNLKKLNHKAKWKNKNHYIADDVMAAIKGKFTVVTFQFPHNDVEQRLVLYAGEKYGSLTLDVDFKDLKLITPLTMGATADKTLYGEEAA